MKRLHFRMSPFRAVGLGIFGLVLVILALWYFFFASSRERVYSLKMSIGRKITPPKRITTFFLERGAAHGIKLQMEDVDGSENSLAMIDRGELDLAVVKGGIRLPPDTKVRQVTALDVEAFHLLVKEAIFKEDWQQTFQTLREKKRININKPSTGTHQWSLDILKFAGFIPIRPDGKGNFTPALLGTPDLTEALAQIKNAPDKDRAQAIITGLPDAILFADPAPSPIVQGLVDLANYRLVPLDFVPAYIENLHAAHHDALDPSVTIEVVTIPAFTYGVGPHPVPKQACATLGLRRLLVAHKDVPPQAIVRFLSMLYDDDPDASLNFLEWGKFRPQYKLHDGVRIYDDERKQVVQNAIVKFGEKLASVLGGLIGAILAIYGYFRWRRLLRFEHYFHEIRRIELIAPASRPTRQRRRANPSC